MSAGNIVGLFLVGLIIAYIIVFNDGYTGTLPDGYEKGLREDCCDF